MITNQYMYDFYNYYRYLPYTNYNIYNNSDFDNRNVKSSMATAIIKGGPLEPNIKGYVYFMDVPYGTNVCVTVTGLPEYKKAEGNKSPIGPHGFHIHEFGNCEVGDEKDPFKSVGSHWNPYNQPHGNHAGDFPVLFSNHGIANMCFFTDKFKVKDIIGKSIIIHENPDDYRTEPSGNSGRKLACGEIVG